VLEVEDERMVCPGGHDFSIVDEIPRFVRSGYAEPFGRQWRRFRRTQLDSYTGLSLSEDRLRRCFGWPRSNEERYADGQTILEAGCGAGRFTEVLLQISGAHVTSVDMSEAVVANAENFPASERHRIAQADIRHLPFVPRSFDYVLCLGVVQHTPSPEETIHALWGQVKPGGWLVFDHYTWDLSRLTRVAQLWRQVFKRLPAEQKLPAVERMVDLLLPVHRRLRRYGRIVSRISPVLSFYHLHPDLSSELQREWAILDTHDTLTDRYKHHRSRRRIRQLLEALGGEEIWVEKGGNGVEARMRRPDV
jgi:2-polyprenyl-3-methyl-5-hydroxy-6-metoxy-1,4-benzoquinol methylase